MSGLLASVRSTRGALELDVQLEIERGETLAVVGPNGAGKTTLLRVLAGLDRPDSGRVELDGTVLDDRSAGVHVAADRRPVGMVFQDNALFPHLSAVSNVEFGMRVGRGGGRRRERLDEASEWLRKVGLEGLDSRRPHELSGGEAQRVALARALAREPALLLLDEPLSALDATTRPALRRELVRQLEAFEGVTLLVTHDPIDAASIATKLLVLEHGRVVQEGSPSDVGEHPRSAYAADLVGVNLFIGTAGTERVLLDGGEVLAVAGELPEGDVFAVVHPRAIALHRSRPEGSPRNVWPGRVGRIESDRGRVRVRIEGALTLVAEVTPAAASELGLALGEDVIATVKASEIVVFPA